MSADESDDEDGGGPATAAARTRDGASNAMALSNAWGF
jgi:hypothetical protein